MKKGFPRVELCVNFIAAPIFRDVAALIIVIRFNDELFLFTCSSTQLEGFPEFCRCQGGFTDCPMSIAHLPVSHGEIWVELGGSLQKGQRRRGVKIHKK